MLPAPVSVSHPLIRGPHGRGFRWGRDGGSQKCQQRAETGARAFRGCRRCIDLAPASGRM